MNKENEQHEIDELLSLYIDEQLSERGDTEVKRLILHDEKIAEKLRSMQRARRLLNALPTAAAPETMADDVQAALERRFILGQNSPQVNESAGKRHLFVQRSLAAAVLVGFFGIFGWIILNIMMPAPALETNFAIVTPPPEPAVEPDVMPEAAAAIATTTIPSTYQPKYKTEPFDGTLLLATNQPVEVNNFLKKTIYSNGLIDYTIPKQHGSNRSYHITCSADAVINLLADMQLLWEKCETAKLTVFNSSTHDSIGINDISNAQLARLIEPATSSVRTKMAKSFARVNELTETPADTFASGDDFPGTSILEVPVKPMLTSDTEPADAEGADKSKTVKITITVVSL